MGMSAGGGEVDVADDHVFARYLVAARKLHCYLCRRAPSDVLEAHIADLYQ